LDGGADGLDLIRKLLKVAPERLSPSGLILIEIEASQGRATLSLARETFPDAHLDLYKDLAGRDRLLIVELTDKADRNKQ
jgi:release factor glutamine methyltransferase